MQEQTYATALAAVRVLRALVALAAISIVAQSCATSSGDEPDRSPDPVVSSGRTWPVLAETPHLPIGMNLSELSYYSPFLLFTDAMKTSGEMMSVHAGSGWDSQAIDRIPRDGDGYPLELPVSIDGNSSWVRFMVNNHYAGRYRILFDGTGTLGASAYEIDGRWYIDLDGSGTNEYIDILTSAKDDPVKNMRILPELLADSLAGAAAGAPANGASPFIPEVVEALKEFHVIRFMDIQRTNFSVHRNWEDRASPAYYSQATIRGMSHEYAIALANETGCDAWVCVPTSPLSPPILGTTSPKRTRT